VIIIPIYLVVKPSGETTKMDKELQDQAIKWATEVYTKFKIAVENPGQPLENADLDLYRELTEWEWFNLNPSEEITIKHLAIRKYGKLKWAKDHPPKPKPSAWEMVTGRKAKK